MSLKPFDLPADLESAYLALLAEHSVVVAERDVAVAQAANAQAMLSDNDALIAALELKIESSGVNCAVSVPSARRVCSINWSCSSKNW